MPQQALSAIQPDALYTQTELAPILTEDERRAIEYAEQIAKLREAGIRPPSYTDEAQCAHCGPVYLWRGVPSRVTQCPWDGSLSRGVEIPRPTVACVDCEHFSHDAHGAGGIG